MDHREPPSAGPGLWPRNQADLNLAREGESVLARLEESLVRLDRIGWLLPAAHLSQAVESVREKVLSLQLDQESGAEGVAP